LKTPQELQWRNWTQKKSQAGGEAEKEGDGSDGASTTSGSSFS